MNRLLTSADVANRLQISVDTARTYMQAMNPVTLGNRLRVTESALEAWLRKRQRAADKPAAPARTARMTPTFHP